MQTEVDEELDRLEERAQRLASSLDYLTDDDLIVLFAVTTSTLIAWRKRGTGPAYVLAGNRYLYPRHAVADWLRSKAREPRGVDPRSVL